MVQPLGKAVCQLLRKLSIELHVTQQSHTRYFPKSNENTGPQTDLYASVHSSIFIVAKKERQPKCESADEKQNDVVCLGYGMLFSHERK